MRAAVKAAREREEAIAAEHERHKEHAGGFGLLGLSRLAERGLSLLGFTFKHTHAVGEDDAPESASAPAQQGAAARAEADAALRGMRQQLEASLGAPLLQRALAVAVDSMPTDAPGESAWGAWEAERLAALAAVLNQSAEEDTPPPEQQPPAPPSGAAGAAEAVARAVLALALWQAQAFEV